MPDGAKWRHTLSNEAHQGQIEPIEVNRTANRVKQEQTSTRGIKKGTLLSYISIFGLCHIPYRLSLILYILSLMNKPYPITPNPNPLLLSIIFYPISNISYYSLSIISDPFIRMSRKYPFFKLTFLQLLKNFCDYEVNMPFWY